MSVSSSVVITDPLGLHARPAAQFVEKARTFASDVTLDKDGTSANCKSLLSILKLGVTQGTEVTVTASGDDEQGALDALLALLQAEPEAERSP
ncbi:MAG: fruB [Blastococcus sp.]|jgi:phosphocarrier protein HPr|nr:fruB [Blastococcus sp.]